MRRGGLQDDRGSGSVLVVGVVVCLLLVLAAGLAVVAAVVAGQRARTVADLAAVAGASALVRGAADPCGVAARVAKTNGGRLVSCNVAGLVVEVRAETDAPSVVRPAQGAARAGPGE